MTTIPRSGGVGVPSGPPAPVSRWRRPGRVMLPGAGRSRVVAPGRERGVPMGHYVIRVNGNLSRELTDAFPSLAAVAEPAQTVLHGYLTDQAALAGILNHLDMLGVD